MAYSLDMRQRALELGKEGKSKTEISKMLGVSRTSILRWSKRASRGELGATYPKERGGFRVDDEKLKAYVAQNPDAYQAEIAEAIGAKENTVCRALKRLKISRKKRHRSTENEMKKNETLI
ncbi:IS630 transposase-related protein [Pleurocapsa sp. PCC 7319]|uniref:IS630 transposase-related protein n=1 Tax=Pleurocapsa sp. PCC 7319 TaxID=118161 RepID=UPI000381204F|nr:IS630 transposase-related protein [Pleurocapsa sp. PCC 7319]